MIKINRLGFAALVGLLTTSSAFARASGDCISNATSLKSAQTATLVNEYDPELKEYYDYGCHYYKVTLTRGQAYTIWITGDNAKDIEFSVDTDWEDESAPLAMFDYDEKSDGATKIGYLYADAWDEEEDPSKGTYYVSLSGEIGASTTLQFVSGIKSFVQEGEDGNPRRLTVTDTQQKDVKNLIEGEFYYIASLKADRKYRFRTTSGTKAFPLSISVDSTAFWEKDPDFTNDVNNAAILVYPDEDVDFSFCVQGPAGASTEAFVLKYQSYPERLPEAHCTWTSANQLTADNNYTVSMIPGRLTANKSYFDAVIDESLARIYLEAGQREVFETSGATGWMEMRVYDAAGTILASNETLGNGSKECRAAIQVSAAGWYYVGVCDPELEYWEAKPTSPTIKLTAREADEVGTRDEFDPGDDARTGATTIFALPATKSSEVLWGVNLGSHTLSSGDWYDWIALPCRKGTTYAVKANFDTDTQTDLHLFARVYRMVDGVATRYKDVRGSLTPYDVDQSTSPLIFTADCNGMFYIRVSVSEGIGLDYPSVCYCAVAYLDDATPLGLLSGTTLGVDGSWYLKDDATAVYPNGASVALPAGSATVCFVADEAGAYKTPGSQTKTVQTWLSSSNVTTAVGRYTDTYDTGDDVQGGFVKIYPTHDGARASRTLWTNDSADWFRFTAVAGTYYNFTLEDCSEARGTSAAGDAVMTILSTAGKTVVSSVTKSLKRTYAAGKYYIRVEHANASSKKDSCYDLVYDSVAVGTLSLASSAITAANDSGYVDVTVNRSAAEGRVRLNFATAEDTAQPGKAYYPTNGILEWADGDTSAKTVRVRLIPDLVQHYGANQKFSVKFWAMTSDCLADDEYAAVISGASAATVTLKRTTEADPGAVEMVLPDPRTVRGGETMTAVFRRTGGTDGKIAVKVKTQSSTALVGTQAGDGSDLKYVKTVLTWNAGEGGDKTVEVPTWATDWTGEAKQFRFKLATLSTGTYAGYLKPELPESKIYVTIENALQPGSVILRTPENREVAPGGTAKFVFSRVGGSSGSIAVKVKTQSSTALVGTTEGDGSDLKYTKEVLTWADGDAADKTLEVPVWSVDAWRATKQFRLKLATMATGTYAGNLTPTLPENKIYISIVSPLVPAADAGGPLTSVTGGRNADGTVVRPGKTIELAQGVYVWLAIGSTNKTTATAASVIDGALPPGLTLNASTLRLTGIPTVPGDYSALVRTQGGTKKGDGVWLDFRVASVGTAFGSFSGVLSGDALVLADGYTRLGSLAFTAASNGVQSAKVKVGGSTYKFSKSAGYDKVTWRNDAAQGQTMKLSSVLRCVVTSGSAVYTNTLTVTVGSGDVTNAVAIAQPAGSAALDLNVLGTSAGVQESVAYACDLTRDCSDNAAFTAAMADFAGYYTVALVPFGVTPSMGVPCGNGYVTLTVDEEGLVRGAGLLADGTELSFSARGSLQGDLSSPSACTFVVPVFQKTTPYCFGGVLQINWAETTAEGETYPALTVDSRQPLYWFKDGATASYDGAGFAIEIRPTGGWYNTVFNLQTYYLNRDFTVEAQAVDGLPAELLPSGCTYSADTMPHDLTALLNVNTVTVPSRVFVQRTDNPTLWDLAKSVNPWKVTTSLVRETGVITGTFKAWSDGATQKQFATYRHYGILPMYRDAYSPLEADVFTAGFYLMPVTTDWTSSLPFNIRFVEYESRDWSEAEVPAK